jgi:2-haloacid dehalogenase
MTVVRAVLFDLLMAVMDSLATWSAAAGERRIGLAWRDAVTARMAASRAYSAYEQLVADAAVEVGLPPTAPSELLARWAEMEPWPDAAALRGLSLPYGFVTNCSSELARLAASRSGLTPRFILSAEEAGWYKPDARIYHAACRRLGSTPERTLFVAGSPYDADGARAVGMDAWLVIRRPDQPPPTTGVRAVRSLAEVVGFGRSRAQT